MCDDESTYARCWNRRFGTDCHGQGGCGGRDIVHFQKAGHSIDGPIPDTTIAISLSKDVRTAESLALSGTSACFVQIQRTTYDSVASVHGSWKGVRVWYHSRHPPGDAEI